MQCGRLFHTHEALAAAAAVAAGLLRRRGRLLLVGLLRLLDDLRQAHTLLVGAPLLHRRHRGLYVREPSVRHFIS